MAYKSKYRPQNPEKYLGDIKSIICRSSWERILAKHLDHNPKCIHWNMEGIVIPYIDKGSGKRRRYYMDFYIEWEDHEIILVEVKPAVQTKPPKAKRKTRKYLKEVTTYATNISKWEAAQIYAERRGWKFEVWTEHKLRSIGLKII